MGKEGKGWKEIGAEGTEVILANVKRNPPNAKNESRLQLANVNSSLFLQSRLRVLNFCALSLKVNQFYHAVIFVLRTASLYSIYSNWLGLSV